MRVAVVASAQIFGGFQNLPPPQSLDFSAFFGLSHLFPPRLSISVIFDTDLVTLQLRRTFKPEFLNRIDETIVFRRLSRAEIRSIAERMLLTVAERFKALGMTLSVPDQVVDFLAERGYDEKYGARPLRRAIRSMIEDKAAELMLTDSLGRGDTVQARIDGNELILTKHGV